MHPSSSSSLLLSPNSCESYFKIGSKTRRYSVIGCVGYEHANPSISIRSVETVDVGVGCDESSGSDGDTTCAICLESIGPALHGAPNKNVATTECGHTFCLSCLLKNLHTSNLCPLCRTPVEKGVKHILKPLSYTDGIGLLDRELNGLRILEEVEHFIQNAIEVSSQPNTNGQNVEDVVGDVMNMVTNFGFNLLYDATLHTSGGEQHMDNEWIIQMYNSYSESGDDNSSMNDYNDSESSDTDDDADADDDTESSSDSDDERERERENESSSDHGHHTHDDGDDDSESSEKKIRVTLPEIPESMLL